MVTPTTRLAASEALVSGVRASCSALIASLTAADFWRRTSCTASVAVSGLATTTSSCITTLVSSPRETSMRVVLPFSTTTELMRRPAFISAQTRRL